MNNYKLAKIGMVLTLTICMAVLTSCAVFLFDESVDSVEKTSKVLVDFNGCYENKAQYYSKNSAGVSTSSIFDETSVSSKGSAEYIRISVVQGQNLKIDGFKSGCKMYEKIYVMGKNFHFEDGEIILTDLSDYAGDPGNQGIGIGGNKIKWIINENNDLVVINKGGGVGLAFIVPVVAAGKAMSVYNRVDNANPVSKYDADCSGSIEQ